MTIVMMMIHAILYLVVRSLSDAGPWLVRHQDPGLVRVPARIIIFREKDFLMFSIKGRD